MCKSWWFCIGMGWLPLSVGIMTATTFVVSYCISVGLGHVPAEFPYISDTGTYVPESCIFGQLLNITAALAFATMYVRYKQVVEFNREASRTVLRWNKISFVIGGLACLGMSMVANFQETNELIVHVIAANLCFGPGVVYCYIQTWLSYKMAPFHATIFACRARCLVCISATVGFVFELPVSVDTVHFTGAYMCFGLGVVYAHIHAWIPWENFAFSEWCKTCVCRVRVALAVVGSVAMICASIFAALAAQKYHGEKQTQWKPEDGGFTEHILSTAFEWVLAISFLSYFFTFVREFQKIVMETQLRLYQEDMEPINDPEI